MHNTIFLFVILKIIINRSLYICCCLNGSNSQLLLKNNHPAKNGAKITQHNIAENKIIIEYSFNHLKRTNYETTR